MEIAIALIVGLVIGAALSMIRTDGYMRIDTTNPEKDLYLLDIKTDLDKIPKRRRLHLKVDTKYKKPR